jgi:hypothetical protein
MTLARVAVGLAIVFACAVIVFALASADAAVTPGCTLAPGQVLTCTTNAECIPFGAVCDPVVGFCACPSTSDGSGEVPDAAGVDAANVSLRDAGTSSTLVIPSNSGGAVERPITHGCNYSGR